MIDHNGRRHRRLSVRMPVRISTIDSETDPRTGKPFFRTSQETCANVSCGGAFVTTGEPVTPGRRLLVELEIPHGPKLQAIGRVAWSKVGMTPSERLPQSGIGVEFVGGSAEEFQALERYIAGEEPESQETSPPERVRQPANRGSA